MARQARLDAPGTLHHVMVRGIKRRRIVDDEQDLKEFVARLGAVARETATSVYAWALMTNHAHILLSSGVQGLSKFMRRLLTGYAVAYNIRHRRHGHLFQNRYKSIVCDGDSYFTELVRYIHLNPLRVKLVKNINELERYPYCGHGVVTGRHRATWQDRKYVLGWFGRRESEARKAYRKFVKEGITLGRRPELVGGGLIRSAGGWSEVASLRRQGGKEITDERILGSGNFVERVLKADKQTKGAYTARERKKRVKQLIVGRCRKGNISVSEFKDGSRRGTIPQVRVEIANSLVDKFGLPLAEIARQVGVSTSAISKALRRTGK